MIASLGNRFWGIWMATVLCLLVGIQNSSRLANVGPPRLLGGTFLQLTNDHAEWTLETWRDLFECLQQLQLSELVIQWTVYENTAFSPSATFDSVTKPPLETVLELADEAGIKVILGLISDPQYWETIRQDPSLVRAYLQRLGERSESLASELAPVVHAHPSFQGWYIPQEIEDKTWGEPGRRKALFEYLRTLASRLREITPEARVAISGFSQAPAEPRTIEDFWGNLLKQAPIDVVFFQDGIGVDNLRLDHLPDYLAAVAKAVELHSRELQVIVEIFRQVDGPPFNDHPFRAVPAPLGRIHRQMQLVAQYTSAGTIAFSVPEYMTPLGGSEAGKLFHDYRATYALSSMTQF